MSTISTTTAILDQVRSEFDFNVAKFPLSGPDNMTTPWYGLFRDDTSEVVGNGSVTERYTPHTTDDVCALVEAAQNIFEGDVNVNCYWRSGHYVNITPSNEHRLAVYGTKDNVFPRIVINAGYDGRPFNAAMGYYRDACQNLAMLQSVDFVSVSFRHTSGLRGKMSSLIASLTGLREGWESLTDVIQGMQSREVSLAGFLNDVYGELPADASQRATTMHTNRTEAIFRRVVRERMTTGREAIGNDFVVSAWEAYNAVQGYSQHDSNRRGTVSDWDRILLASRDANVKRAEVLALAV